MSTELTKRESDDVMTIQKLSRVFYQSGYFRDIKDEAQAMVKILYGRELGFSPVVSMMGINVIDGKPALSGHLFGTLVKRNPQYDYRVKESTNQVCTLEFFAVKEKRRESLGVSTFTIEDAQRAGLVRAGGGWTKYPKAMLFNRALSAGVRLHCPDVSACPLYVPEELGATVDEEGAVTELPKSARPVETIEQEIEINKHSMDAVKYRTGPMTHADVVKANGGLGQAAVVSPSPAAPTRTDPKIIEGIERIADKYLGGPTQAPTLEALKAKLDELAPEPVEPGVTFIDTKQQAHFRKRFRDALPEDLKGNSEVLLHDFLAFHKFIGPDANPHLHLIPETEYQKFGKLALAHAKTLGSTDASF